jgi:hypothetical protein
VAHPESFSRALERGLASDRAEAGQVAVKEEGPVRKALQGPLKKALQATVQRSGKWPSKRKGSSGGLFKGP